MKMLPSLLCVLSLLFIGVCDAETKTKFYENGQKESEGNYKDGKMHGLWTEWDEEGNVTEQAKFENGEKVE